MLYSKLSKSIRLILWNQAGTKNDAKHTKVSPQKKYASTINISCKISGALFVNVLAVNAAYANDYVQNTATYDIQNNPQIKSNNLAESSHSSSEEKLFKYYQPIEEETAEYQENISDTTEVTYPNNNDANAEPIVENDTTDNGSIAHTDNNHTDKKQNGISQFFSQYSDSYSSNIETPRCYGHWVSPQNVASQNTNNNPQSNTIEGSQKSDTVITDTPTQENEQDVLKAKADYGYYDNENYAELSGNVIIDQGSQHIEADKVTLDLKTNNINAEGGVLFSNRSSQTNNTANKTSNQTNDVKDYNSAGLITIANNLTYDSSNNQSTAQDVAFASVDMQSHGHAEQMIQTEKNIYNLQGVTYTTCPPDERRWHIDAKQIDINTDSGRGVAKNTTLNIANVPVLYLPYFNFPIDSRRNSGFLLPKVKYDESLGVSLDVPYYFNLAENYDATLNTIIFSKRNPMLKGEFRYLTENLGYGELHGSFLASDRAYNNKNRTSFAYDHHWQSEKIQNLSVDATYQYVSDSDYFHDFDNFFENSNKVNLPRNITANYFDKNVTAQFKLETYQHLDAEDAFGQRITDAQRPYSKLPQLTVDYHLPSFYTNTLLDGIKLDGVHDSAYFKKDITDNSTLKNSGVRIYNKLTASYPIEKSWGFVKPALSLQHLYTSYDEDSANANNIDKKDRSHSVFVPQASLDMGLHFYKQGSPFNWLGQKGGYQLLTPRIKYVYSPFKQQNDIPNFNTNVASINYEQLYADSWFLGHDRLQDLHAITSGVNYRYIDETGLTRLDASIANQYYLDDGQVSLNNNGLQTDATNNLFSASSSGLVTSVTTQPFNNLWLDVDAALTPNYDLDFITGQVRYQPNKVSLFSLGMTERKENTRTNQLPLSAISASGVFPINNKWRVVAHSQYDFNQNRAIDTVFGLNYEDCCIGFSIYNRRYYNDLRLNEGPKNQLMLQLKLNGLSNGSEQANSLLLNKLFGFDKIQQHWLR